MSVTQSDLRAMAEKHRGTNVAVSAILTSLLECEIQAKQHLGAVRGYVGIVEKAVEGEPDYRVMLDQSDLVTSAAKAATALSRIAADYMTLATILQGLGENVDGY